MRLLQQRYIIFCKVQVSNMIFISSPIDELENIKQAYSIYYLKKFISKYIDYNLLVRVYQFTN